MTPQERRLLVDGQPEVNAQALIVIAAWQTLESTRPLGLRPIPVKGAPPVLVPFRGEIPWTAVKEYGELHGLGREGIALLADVIARLDAERSERETNEIKRKAPR